MKNDSKRMKQYVRPWGSYICLDRGVGYQVKRLIINLHTIKKIYFIQ